MSLQGCRWAWQAAVTNLPVPEAGFQPVELPINVDPEKKEARKTVEVQWHPWLPELRLTVKDAAGTLKMDGVDVELDRSGILKAFLEEWTP